MHGQNVVSHINIQLLHACITQAHAILHIHLRPSVSNVFLVHESYRQGVQEYITGNRQRERKGWESSHVCH